MTGRFSKRKAAKADDRGHLHAGLEQDHQLSNGRQQALLELHRLVGNSAIEELLRSSHFADVRVHTGPTAQSRAEAEGAAAFTTEKDVYLGKNIDLATELGQRVLAHELTHVVQQARSRQGSPLASETNLEGEAAFISGVGTGRTMTEVGGAPSGTVQKITEAELEQEWRRLHPKKGLFRKTAKPGEIAEIDEEAEHADRQAYESWRQSQLGQLGLQNAIKVPAWTEAQERTKRPATEEELNAPEATVGQAQQAQQSDVQHKPLTPELHVEAPPEQQQRRDWATEWNTLTPKQRGKQIYPQRATPKQRMENAKRPLPRFLTEVDKSLLQIERTAKMVPFLRGGISLVQGITGGDIIGQDVDRVDALLEAARSTFEDLTLILGPEDLMIGGSRQGTRVAREVEQGIAQGGVKLGPEVKPIEDVLAGSKFEVSPLSPSEAKASIRQPTEVPSTPKSLPEGQPGQLVEPTATTGERAAETVPASAVETPKPLPAEKTAAERATETISAPPVEAPQARPVEQPGSSPPSTIEPSSTPIENIQPGEARAETQTYSTEDLSNRLRTNEKRIRQLENQQSTKARAARRNPETVASEIRSLKQENELLRQEIKSLTPPKPKEPLADLERRWFKQRRGETLDAYRKRMTAREEMVLDEATRVGGRSDIAERYEGLMKDLEQRSNRLKAAQTERAAAEAQYGEVRKQWASAKESARKQQAAFKADPELEKTLQRTKEKLDLAELEIQRAQSGFSTPAELAEKSVARDWLLEHGGYRNVRSIQNASGHGIDLVAERILDDKTVFFEVKSSISKRPKNLEARQQDITFFITDSLERSTSVEAKELLRSVNPNEIEGFVIEVTDVDLLTGKGNVKPLKPW